MNINIQNREQAIMVVGGLIVAGIIGFYIISALFGGSGNVPEDFDNDSVNVIEYSEDTVIIETTDPRVVDEETLRELTGVDEDTQVIIDIPGAADRYIFDADPYYYPPLEEAPLENYEGTPESAYD